MLFIALVLRVLSYAINCSKQILIEVLLQEKICPCVYEVMFMF